MDEFDTNVVAHLEPLSALHEPSFGRWQDKPNPSALVCRTGDDGVELLADFSRKQERCSGLVDLTLNLGGGVFLVGAVLGEVRQFRDGVGQWRTGQRGFQEPLCDEVRKTPVRRGGMRVIFHRQREMSRRLAAGKIQRIFAAPDELDDGQGKIGELFRGGGAAARQKTFERDSIRCGGELVP